MLDWGLMGLVFVPVFLVELPDKTFVATLVLSARYRPLAVWLGVGLAFGIQCLVAVTAGQVVGYLPQAVVHGITVAIFSVGAFLLIRAAPSAEEEERQAESDFAARAGRPRSFARAAAASFGIIFAAEWGDLTQLLTISFVGRYSHPVSVFLGAWGALLVVSGLAAVTGRLLLRHVHLSYIYYAGAAVCIGFALWNAVEMVHAR